LSQSFGRSKPFSHANRDEFVILKGAPRLEESASGKPAPSVAQYYSDVFMNHEGTKSTKKCMKSSIQASDPLQIVRFSPAADSLAGMFVDN
jgi:hypothetical protein